MCMSQKSYLLFEDTYLAYIYTYIYIYNNAKNYDGYTKRDKVKIYNESTRGKTYER